MTGADLLPPSADAKFADRVGDALDEFGTERGALLREMAAATQRRDYGAKATAVGKAATSAAAAVARIESPSAYEAASRAALEKALAAVAGAYDALGGAAAQRPARFADARTRVRAAETALDGVVDGLGRIGYALDGS